VLGRPFVSRGIAVELDRPVERLVFRDLRAAKDFLGPIARDPLSFPDLRRIAQGLAPGAPMREIDEVVARVAAALVDGRIAFRRVQMDLPAGEAMNRPEPKDGGGEGDGSGVELTWIEVRLLDAAGSGVSGQRCVVVAPDAQRHEVYTDSLGTAKVQGIPSGACKILYPDIDPAALPKTEAPQPTRSEMRERLTVHELKAGVSRQTTEVHELRLVNLTLRVRLAIDPNATASRDDKFILHAVKGSAEQQIIKTIADDQVPGDSSVDLVYEHLWRDHRYTLEVDPGAEGEPYNVIQDTPLQQLLAH
jgi:hypothetical protein